MTDDLYQDPFEDLRDLAIPEDFEEVPEIADDQVFRITGLGLYTIGLINEEVLHKFQAIEEERDVAIALTHDYDEIIAFLIEHLAAVMDCDTLEEAADLADVALSHVEQIDV